MFQTNFLKGTVAIVTGASSGIGAGIAAALGGAGASVVVNYHSDEKGAKKTAKKIDESGGKSLVHGADVSKELDVKDMFDACLAKFGALDIVVSNSGIQKDAPAAEMSLDDWSAVIAVNLTGHFLTSREAIRRFAKGSSKNNFRSRGNVIFISSVHEIIPWAGHVNYAASKGGIKMLMKSLAQEYAQEKMRFNSIAPGAIKTNINTAAWNTKKASADLMEKIPYRRIGDASDTANLALFLASDASDYITGETIVIDGGMQLYPSFREGG